MEEPILRRRSDYFLITDNPYPRIDKGSHTGLEVA